MRANSAAAGAAKKPPRCTCADNIPLVDYLFKQSSGARDRGNDHLHKSYRKVIANMSQYPLAITSIDQARLIGGVGDFLAGVIEKQLAIQFQHGSPPSSLTLLPAEIQAVLTRRGIMKDPSQVKPIRKRKDHNSSGATAAASSSSSNGDSKDSGNDNDDVDLTIPSSKRSKPGAANGAPASLIAAAPAKRGNGGKKAYRPRSGTSAYSLLIAFAVHHVGATGTVEALKKRELLDHARPYTTGTYQPAMVGIAATADELKSATFTSGMNSLEKHQLVIVEDTNPKRWNVTDSGLALARELQAIAEGRHVPSSSSSSVAVSDSKTAPSAAISSSSSLSRSSSVPIISQSSLHRTIITAPSVSPAPAIARASVPAAPSLASSSSSSSSSLASRSITPVPFIVNDSNDRSMISSSGYEVVCIVDIRERGRGGDAKTLCDGLARKGIKSETYSLAIGDFLWVARPIGAPIQDAIVLNGIIERKRLADLISSIFGGRYHEQRSRLVKTGITRLAYLVEGTAKSHYHGPQVPQAAVDTALASLNAVHGFMVFHSRDVPDTIRLLTMISNQVIADVAAKGVPARVSPSSIAAAVAAIEAAYASSSSSSSPLMARSSSASVAGRSASPAISSFARPPPIGGETLADFCDRMQKGAEETSSNRIMFGTQLRMIKGCSADRVLAILDKYPTARLLSDAYDQCGSDVEQDILLAKLQYGPNNKSMGPAISKRIRTFFRSDAYAAADS